MTCGVAPSLMFLYTQQRMTARAYCSYLYFNHQSGKLLHKKLLVQHLRLHKSIMVIDVFVLLKGFSGSFFCVLFSLGQRKNIWAGTNPFPFLRIESARTLP